MRLRKRAFCLCSLCSLLFPFCPLYWHTQPWRQPPTSHPQARCLGAAQALIRYLSFKIPYLRWSAWLATRLYGAWAWFVARLRPGSKGFSPPEGARIGDGIGRSAGAGRIEGIVYCDGTKARGEKAENGVRARLTGNDQPARAGAGKEGIVTQASVNRLGAAHDPRTRAGPGGKPWELAVPGGSACARGSGREFRAAGNQSAADPPEPGRDRPGRR